MCYVVHYETDDNDFDRIKQLDSYCCSKDYQRDVFIPKKLVVSVQKYDSFSHHLNSMFRCNISCATEKDASKFHFILSYVFEAMGMEGCECMADEVEGYADTSMNPKCQGMERIYPLYEVRVKNLFPEVYYEKVLPVCSYYLHPCEHEHMERFLAGTDDPLYDFVHELRYNPRAMPVSPELEMAREDFQKKRKLEDPHSLKEFQFLGLAK
jgi:hypothetical protein